MSFSQQQYSSLLDYDYLMKVVVIGESGVGKSSLLKRYTEDEFYPSYVSTIGVDFEVATQVVNDKLVKLQLWDTAGQERFHNITTSYYRGANAVLVVFDVTAPDSFHTIPKWVNEVKKYASKDAQIMLVANKADLDRRRMVSVEDLKQMADNMDVPYIETSAKSAHNVEEAFISLAGRFTEYRSSRQLEQSMAASDVFSPLSAPLSFGHSPSLTECCVLL